MANRVRSDYEAMSRVRWQLGEIGREIRIARLAAGRRVRDLADAVGTSPARISRIERGLVPSVTVRQVSAVGAAAGLKIHLRTYPAGRRLVDAPQLELLRQLRARAHPSWIWSTEVPMPIRGDLRAADATARIPGCLVMLELWTRMVDFQAQTRSALLKQRDLGADRLVIVLLGGGANRRTLREAAGVVRESFPVGTRAMLLALAEGRDPGANGVVVLRAPRSLPAGATIGDDRRHP